VRSARTSGPPRRGSRVPIEASFRGDVLQPSAPSIVGLPKPSTTAVDFGAILGELDANDLERWMLQREKLDHGPFRDRELAEMILRGGALAEHAVTNLETGKRAKLKHVEEFKPFLDKYRIRKKQEEEQEAIRRSVRVERFGLAAKAGIAAGILVAVAGASAGLYYGLRGGGGEAAAVREDHKVALAGPSQVKGIQDIEVEVLEKVPPAADVAKQKSRRRPGSPGGRQPGGSGRVAGGMEDWDSAWTRGGDLDLASGDSAAPILTARDINVKMRSKQGALFSCLRGEMSRDSGLHGRVNIEMLIRGDRIVSVRSPDRSGAFENCLQDALSSVRFDAQAYGQMRSAFSMEANR
ncbi:MAG: hypothetical protein QME96_02660, partial [Myxococcota bacterium]|nr:hypothetical protein [Myxococcota bacterium]